MFAIQVSEDWHVSAGEHQLSVSLCSTLREYNTFEEVEGEQMGE